MLIYRILLIYVDFEKQIMLATPEILVSINLSLNPKPSRFSMLDSRIDFLEVSFDELLLRNFYKCVKIVRNKIANPFLRAVIYLAN